MKLLVYFIGLGDSFIDYVTYLTTLRVKKRIKFNTNKYLYETVKISSLPESD